MPFLRADPVEAIKFRMEQQGLTPTDLEPFIGGSGRVSEVLNYKRPLSLRMIKRLHEGLHIPYERLLAGGGGWYVATAHSLSLKNSGSR